MDAKDLDRRATALRDGVVSRQGALRVFSSAVVTAMVAPFLSQPAAAGTKQAKRRCRRKEGVFLRKGQCRCGWTCSANPTKFGCGGGPCRCLKTAAGKGFCGDLFSFDDKLAACSTNAECPTGRTCVVVAGCGGSGGNCATPADCNADLGHTCINGSCQVTLCVTPCPA